MRHAILGAAGQLGRQLCRLLPGEVHPFARADVDLTQLATLSRLRDLRPDVVLNCAAYNLVDRAESEPETAFASNAFGVRHLAQLCRELDCLLVHFSTNYVFGLDAQRRTPYAESDTPGPISAYGLSKLAGEYFVRAFSPRFLVLRTCGLFGPPGANGNFVEMMLRRAAADQPTRVVNDQTCTPTFSADLAAATVALLAAGRTGVWHLTNADSCTWYEFARAIFELAGLSPDLTPVSSAEFGAAARRPTYSALISTQPDPPAAARLRPWHEALAAYMSGPSIKA